MQPYLTITQLISTIATLMYFTNLHDQASLITAKRNRDSHLQQELAREHCISSYKTAVSGWGYSLQS